MAHATSTSNLAGEVLSGNPRALARAATLIESNTQLGRDLVSSVFRETGKAFTLGITGPPGAGKSTLVNQLIRHFRASGQKVGVIAVDPSSPYSHGAILGDRIRLNEHFGDPGVFIRSMATRGKLGGLAGATLDMTLLLDAAGFEVVLIETVGVGQDEIDIASLADLTMVVLVPGLGDDVQAMKAGIMEIAHVLVINKADLPGADRLEEELRFAQSLSGNATREHAAPIIRVTASEGTGVQELVSVTLAACERAKSNADNAALWSSRLREMLRESVLLHLDPAKLENYAAQVSARLVSPHDAVASLHDSLLTAVRKFE